MRFLRAAVVVVVLAGCGDPSTLRMNHVQAFGTHNSYHLEQETPIDPSHAYSHPPLDRQLELGVRQFELDLHLNVSGRFEVFHLPGGVDSETTCKYFTDCLSLMKAWSDEHEDHLPLMIWLEPKDEDFDWADMRYRPIADKYRELEAEILSVWPAERVIKPDDVRGAFATLPEALAAQGWPLLDEVRGRVLFSMLDDENHRARYLAGAENLAGKLLFADTSSTADPWAATFKINDAESDGDEIVRLVAGGFLVTTNIDDVTSSTTSNARRVAASIESGAHFLSTDFTEIVVAPSCNPIAAPAGCASELIDR